MIIIVHSSRKITRVYHSTPLIRIYLFILKIIFFILDNVFYSLKIIFTKILLFMNQTIYMNK